MTDIGSSFVVKEFRSNIQHIVLSAVNTLLKIGASRVHSKHTKVQDIPVPRDTGGFGGAKRHVPPCCFVYWT